MALASWALLAALLGAPGDAQAQERTKVAVVSAGDYQRVLDDAATRGIGAHGQAVRAQMSQRDVAAVWSSRKTAPLVSVAKGKGADLALALLGLNVRGVPSTQVMLVDTDGRILGQATLTVGTYRGRGRRRRFVRRSAELEDWVASRVGPAAAALAKLAASEPPPTSAPSEFTRGPAAGVMKDASTSPSLGFGMDISAGLALSGRQYNYNDPLSDNLREYGLGITPAPAVNVALFPLLWRTSSGHRRALGVLGGYFMAPGLASRVADSEDRLETKWQAWHAGLAFDAELSRGFGVRPSVRYGEHEFDFTGSADELIPQLPRVHYRYVRVGGEVRGKVSVLDLYGDVGYRFMAASGVIGDEYFPYSRVGAFDLRFTAAFRLIAGLEARAGIEYVHVYYDFLPEPGDPYVAGGALDLYYTLHVGLAYVYWGD